LFFPRLESAIDSYQASLDALQTDNYWPGLPQLHSHKILDLYFQLHDWQSWTAWQHRYAATTPAPAPDTAYIAALASFESEQYDTAKQQAKAIAPPSLTYESLWNTSDLETTALKEIFRSVLSPDNSSHDKDTNKDLAERLLDANLRVLCLDEQSVWGSERAMLGQLLHVRQPDASLPFIKSLKLDASSTSLKHLTHLMLIVQRRLSKSDAFSDLRLATARLARKQDNLRLAERLLSGQVRALRTRAGLEEVVEAGGASGFLADYAQLSERVAAGHGAQLSLVESEFEAAKLLKRLGGQLRLDCLELMAGIALRHADAHFRRPDPGQFAAPVTRLFTNPVVQSQAHFNAASVNDLLSEKCAKALLSLVKCLRRDEAEVLRSVHSSHPRPTHLDKIAHLLRKLSSFKTSHVGTAFSLVREPRLGLNASETFLGDLHDLATVFSPKQAKTWFELASWCYKCGRESADLVQQALDGGAEDSALFCQLPPHASQAERDLVASALSASLGLVNMGIVGGLRESAACSRDRDERLAETRQLLVESCGSLTPESVDGLVEAWTRTVDRVFYFHRIACRSYFTFLSLSDQVGLKS